MMNTGETLYEVNDKTMIGELQDCVKVVEDRAKDVFKGREPPSGFVHPLDNEVIGPSGLLSGLLREGENEIPYTRAEAVDELWFELIDKSIRCLRFFDKREPYLESEGRPVIAYGMDSLKDYRDRYTAFESLMYGASPYYRDHVFHVVRVWLIGAFVLIRGVGKGEGENGLVEDIRLDGDARFDGEISFFEKMSMWTICALCHDLGYPLEKAEQILDRTKDMMREFVPSPNILSNFSFTGTQDSINDYILRFMSTKMRRVGAWRDGSGDSSSAGEPTYVGRIQPKYYLKYAKSLEKFQHGVISSVILYKMLLFFLESDFNMNDDYTYTQEDARQFYIRREILRAIASHTCSDTYNVHICTLLSLLFMCDELQEWGRKSWSELYTGVPAKSVRLALNSFTRERIDIIEEIELEGSGIVETAAETVVRLFKRQYSLYKTIFRDGQHTSQRDFDLRKKMKLGLPVRRSKRKCIEVTYEIPKGGSGRFSLVFSGFDQSEETAARGAISNGLANALYHADYDDGTGR